MTPSRGPASEVLRSITLTRARMPAMLALWQAPIQDAPPDHDDDKPQPIRQAGGYCPPDQGSFERVADRLSLG